MENIKELLLNALNNISLLEKVQVVKSFMTSERALGDAEKLVFKDAAIALGDYSFSNQLYSVGLDKLFHSVKILYFIKNETAMKSAIENINIIANELRLNWFGKQNLILGQLNISNEWQQLTDKVYYTVLDYTVVEIQERL